MTGTWDGGGWKPEQSGGIVQRHWTLTFDYPRPPLTANQRINRYKRARLVSDVRLAARLMAGRIPPLGRCRVTLTWFVTNRIRRDADNVVPTLKAMCDGLVDAGVMSDDTPDLMVKDMPVIVHDTRARMELRIEALA